jgi:hypothetical protein
LLGGQANESDFMRTGAISSDRAFQHHDDRDHSAYIVTPLVSDLKGAAANQDPVLQNAWGVAFTPAGSPFWIADNATGCSTLYDGDGTKAALQVSIPLPGGAVPATDCKHQPIGSQHG